MEISVELVPPASRKPIPSDVLNLAFGSVFTDHMFLMDYHDGSWHAPRIEPFHDLSLNPAALVLHYGQGIFEGMKAYRSDSRINLFRPQMNVERFNRSAERMVMPTVEPNLFLAALEKLLLLEKDWIPTQPGTSIYIRPTMIATEPKLGVRPAEEYLFYIILSPVGPYFKEGFQPVGIYVTDEHVRAAKGGTGDAKAIGNYAASLFAGVRAKEAGYSQVLWLDALERKYLEEVGTMNILVAFDDEIATPPLSGTILPGITRDSVIHLLRHWGYSVNERKISIDEVIEGIKSGKVTEIFGCGTAAIIAPVGKLYYKGVEYIVADGGIGPITQRLFDDLTGIQSGKLEDPFGWVWTIKE